MIRLVTNATLFLAILSLMNCSDDLTIPTAPELRKFSLQFSNVEPLTNGYIYEAWAVLPNATSSIGKFNLNSSDQMIDTLGAIIASNTIEAPFDLSRASAFLISIEIDATFKNAPSPTVIVAGNLVGSQISLTPNHPLAANLNFASASGTLQLGTPTTEETDDEFSGVWFASGDLTEEPVAGLNIPNLSIEGWLYEGWVIVDGNPITTGKFDIVDSGDLNENDYAGPLGAPFLPGEDFITNAPDGWTFPLDLRGATILITLEPQPDNDQDAPFFVSPLRVVISANAQANTEIQLISQFGTLPTVNATIAQ